MMAWKIRCGKVRIISEHSKKVPVPYYLLHKLSNTPDILLAYQYAGYYAGEQVCSRAYWYACKYSSVFVQEYQYAD